MAEDAKNGLGVHVPVTFTGTQMSEITGNFLYMHRSQNHVFKSSCFRFLKFNDVQNVDLVYKHVTED